MKFRSIKADTSKKLSITYGNKGDIFGIKLMFVLYIIDTNDMFLLNYSFQFAINTINGLKTTHL